MVNIVNVQVSTQVASAPSQLQRTGAFISTGGTTLTVGTAGYATQLITRLADLTAIITPATAITAMTWSGGVVTVTTIGATGIPTGVTVKGVIAAAAPTGYNGTYDCTGVSANSFTYPLASNPGSVSTLGTFQLYSAVELTQMGTTFFAQGSSVPVYVLEFGTLAVNTAITNLTAYIASPTIQFYNYLVPREWDANSALIALAAANSSTTSQLYFYVTTTLTNYTAYSATKSLFTVCEATTVAANEFSAAAFFHKALSYNPSASNLAAPMSFAYLSGVTANVLTGAQQTALKAKGVNWVGTGAEGGISNTLVLWGTFMDVNPFNYWYSIDWTAINVAQALSAAVINGSNTPTNPLYYNQSGINTLTKVAQNKVNSGIAFGLILAPSTVVAVPFTTYVTDNPNDYAAGIYNGLSVTFVPLRGFTEITIYLTASNIPTGA